MSQLPFLRRVREERPLFMRTMTWVFAGALAVPIVWVLYGEVSFLQVLLILLVCLGGGWLGAFYFWHLNDAIQYDVGPLRPPKRKEQDERDV